MAQLKLSVAFAHFPYAGNGAAMKEHPDIRHWEVETALKMKADPRVESFSSRDFCDTPITMTRNRAMREAQKAGIDILVMVDSDQSPSKHAGEPWFKPFWDVAFNFIYENYHKGPRLVFAPYCGPPSEEKGGENVFVFQWATGGIRGHETQFCLESYTREQAALMTGIQEAAAGPTGLMMIDMRLLSLIEPSGLAKREVLERVKDGRMSVEDGEWALKEGFCHYEWEDSYADKKASTEDVTLTRDLSLAGIYKLGYNPVFCAWDSWIGHWKPENVGKPRIYTADRVAETLVRAVRQNHRSTESIVEASNLDNPYSKAESNGHVNRIAKVNGESSEHVGNGYRETVGPWHAHGHAPVEHQTALADLVRSVRYAKGQPLRILEVGSWLGATAMAMADATEDSRVFCVDTWNGTESDCTGRMAKEAGGNDAVYAEFLNRIGDRKDKTIFPFRRSSLEAAAMDWPGGFDLIFLDADHSYEAVKADIEAWWPHLRDDGVMVGHDFEVRGFDGVTKAVREAFSDKYTAFGFHPQGCMWRVYKEFLGVKAMCEVP